MSFNVRLAVEPTVEQLQDKPDGELLQLWHEEACNMSYYNAAEGPQWGIEQLPREACQRRFGRVNEEVKRRGLTPPKGSYLL